MKSINYIINISALLIVIITIIIILIYYQKKIKIDLGKDVSPEIKNIIYSTGILPKIIPIKTLILPKKGTGKEWIKIEVI